jgi:hypothetical protein
MLHCHFSELASQILPYVSVNDDSRKPAPYAGQWPVIAELDWVEKRQTARLLGLRADLRREADITVEVPL